MKTRNGIFLDINESQYKLTTLHTDLIFVFSSDYYRTKFDEQYLKHRKDFNLKLKNRHNIIVDFSTYPDIVLYKRIEKRGFLIMHEGGQKIWQENLLLNGEKATNKNLPAK